MDSSEAPSKTVGRNPWACTVLASRLVDVYSIVFFYFRNRIHGMDAAMKGINRFSYGDFPIGRYFSSLNRQLSVQ